MTAHWEHGVECYMRWNRCRVPGGLTEDEVTAWMDEHVEEIKWLPYTQAEWEAMCKKTYPHLP